MNALLEVVETRGVYALVVVLLGVGLYGMFARPNLIHKIVGLTIAQVAIFLFFIEGSVRKGATAPVIDPTIGSDPAAYVNPLPHLLILTAVVVGAATLGVALALAIRLYQAHGTLEEDALTAALDDRPRPDVDGSVPGQGPTDVDDGERR